LDRKYALLPAGNQVVVEGGASIDASKHETALTRNGRGVPCASGVAHSMQEKGGRGQVHVTCAPVTRQMLQLQLGNVL
jgi:hypothetical protein